MRRDLHQLRDAVRNKFTIFENSTLYWVRRIWTLRSSQSLLVPSNRFAGATCNVTCISCEMRLGTYFLYLKIVLLYGCVGFERFTVVTHFSHFMCGQIDLQVRRAMWLVLNYLYANRRKVSTAGCSVACCVRWVLVVVYAFRTQNLLAASILFLEFDNVLSSFGVNEIPVQESPRLSIPPIFDNSVKPSIDNRLFYQLTSYYRRESGFSWCTKKIGSGPTATTGKYYRKTVPNTTQ